MRMKVTEDIKIAGRFEDYLVVRGAMLDKLRVGVEDDLTGERVSILLDKEGAAKLLELLKDVIEGDNSD